MGNGRSRTNKSQSSANHRLAGFCDWLHDAARAIDYEFNRVESKKRELFKNILTTAIPTQGKTEYVDTPLCWNRLTSFVQSFAILGIRH